MARFSFLNPKTYIVDKEFQYTYILHSLLLLLFLVVSTLLVIIVWNKFRFYRGFLLSPPSTEQLMVWAKDHNVRPDSMEFSFQYIAQAKPHTFYNIIINPILLIFFINIIVISAISLYISYKIALPLHELKIAFRRKIEIGDLDKPLSYRKEDLFNELSSLANLALYVASNPKVKHFKRPEKEGEEKK
jgi:hypothetical protein